MKEFMLQKWNKESSFFEKALLPDGKNHWPRDPVPGEDAYRNWLRDVTDPTTNEFYKGHRDIPQFDEDGKPLKNEAGVDIVERVTIEADYVIQQIVRIRTQQGEFLYSKGMMTGYTQFGDPKTKKFDMPEVWNEQTFSTTTQIDPKDQKWKPMINGPSILITHYDLPFTEANVMKLYEKKDPLIFQMVVKDEVSQRVKECPRLDMFISKPFEYIMNDEYLTAEQKEQRKKEFEAEIAKQKGARK